MPDISLIPVFTGINDAPSAPTEQQGCNGSYVVDKLNEIIGVVNTTALEGESAYQIAVNNGFVGTEAEWLLSLKGEPGEGSGNGSGNPVVNNVIVDNSSGSPVITLNGTNDTFIYNVSHFGTATVKATNWVIGKLYIFVILQGEQGNKDLYFDTDGQTNLTPFDTIGAINLSDYGKTIIGLMSINLYGSPIIIQVFNSNNP